MAEIEENLNILLGCFGRFEDDFICCPGIENRILRITTALPNYEELMNYFDNCKLFDRQILDYNAVRSLITNLYDRFDLPTRKLFSEKQFRVYQKFIIDHKLCGLYIKLGLMPDENIQPKKKSIVIHVAKESEETNTVEKTPLKLVKGNFLK